MYKYYLTQTAFTKNTDTHTNIEKTNKFLRNKQSLELVTEMTQISEFLRNLKQLRNRLNNLVENVKRIHEQMEKFSREIETIKKK